MKKKLLPILAVSLLSLNVGNAQTAKIGLYEEWTGETCPPCAALNPGITTLVENNQTPVRKVILLRYQVAIPSAPTNPISLYQQNSTEPVARHNFYWPGAGKFAPQGRLNGKAFGTGQNVGSVQLITQTEINTAFAANDAPFGMSLSHKLNATLDSVKIKYSINAVQAFTTANPLKLRMAICEHDIEYDVQPGTNGETKFEWVMRKMVPDVNGTTLGGTWTLGQTLTDSFTVKLPTYIWDKNEVSVVAFIQEDKPGPGPTVTRDVHQSAYSENQPLPLDASAFGFKNLSDVTCATSVNPRFVFRNTGVTTLTAATIEYKLNTGAVQTLSWTGSLASGDTTSIAIPTISGLVVGSSNTLALTVKLPNGIVDNNTIKDTKTASFKVLPSASTAQIVAQNFAATTFPPTNWTVISADPLKWARSAAGNNGAGSAKMDFYNSTAGNVDELLIENQDFTSASNATLTFDVSSAPYTAANPENDQLKIEVSPDCGATWTTVYDKVGTALNTAPATTSAFTPSAATQWRAETVALPTFSNPSNVIVKFVGVSDYGNNLYVDNINLGKVTSISKQIIEINSLSVYPNPAKDNLELKFTTINPKTTEVKIFNSLGALVRTQSVDKLSVGVNKLNIDVKDLSNGVYSIQLNQNEGAVSKAFVIQK